MSDGNAAWLVAGAALAGLVFWQRKALAELLLPAPNGAPPPWRRPPSAIEPPAPSAPASLEDRDVVALARTITSEAGDGTVAEREMVGWVARNRARAARVSIDKLVCSPACGPCCQGRPFSSARSAEARDVGLALQILALPVSADPTGGATAFMEPALQDRLVAQGRPGYRYTAAEIRERWRKDGLVPVATVGRFETFRKG
jgi:hypothetical protein